MKIQRHSGQSLIEYSAIAVLVMVGILGMGPHVVRSVNSYFKGAEEQAQDSFREEIHQAKMEGVEVLFDLGPDCNCNLSSAFACGGGDDCFLNEEMRQLMCTPSTCFAEHVAGNLETYQCSQERSLLIKGRTDFLDSSCYPDCMIGGDKENCPVGSSSDSNIFGNCGWECCYPAEEVRPLQCGVLGSVHEGQLLKQRICGPYTNPSNPNYAPQYFWEMDSACSQNCGVKDVNSAWCSALTYNTNVGSDGDIFHVDDGGCLIADAECVSSPPSFLCPNDAWTCMAECDGSIPHFGLLPDGSGCGCDPGWVWNAPTNECVVPLLAYFVYQPFQPSSCENECAIFTTEIDGSCPTSWASPNLLIYFSTALGVSSSINVEYGVTYCHRHDSWGANSEAAIAFSGAYNGFKIMTQHTTVTFCAVFDEPSGTATIVDGACP